MAWLAIRWQGYRIKDTKMFYFRQLDNRMYTLWVVQILQEDVGGESRPALAIVCSEETYLVTLRDTDLGLK